MKAIKILPLLLLTLIINIEVDAQNKTMDFSDPKVPNTPSNYGIEEQMAPELDVPLWVDAQGEEMDPVLLKDLEGKFKVIYCFQAWCPGCHSRGLPALQKMTKALEGLSLIHI